MNSQFDHPAMNQHTDQTVAEETHHYRPESADQHYEDSQSHYEEAQYQQDTIPLYAETEQTHGEFSTQGQYHEAHGQGEYYPSQQEYNGDYHQSQEHDHQPSEEHLYEQDQEYQHQQQYEPENRPVPDSPTERSIRPMDTLPQINLPAELERIKHRLAVLNNGHPGTEIERAALVELERSTEILIMSQKAISEKQRALILLHINDSRRPTLQAELMQLTADSKIMHQQWSVVMEAYHGEFVVAAAAAAAEAAAKARAQMKASLEHDVGILRDQVANLQRQLDAVATRRKQMYADAEEQHRIMRREYSQN